MYSQIVIVVSSLSFVLFTYIDDALPNTNQMNLMLLWSTKILCGDLNCTSVAQDMGQLWFLATALHTSLLRRVLCATLLEIIVNTCLQG